MRNIIKHLEKMLPDSSTKTNHAGIISKLINVLEQSREEDLGLLSNRQRYVSAMYDAYKEMPSDEEQLSEWILSKSDELEAVPLDKDNPEKGGEIEQYAGKIRRILKFLQSTLPDDGKTEK